MNRFYLLVLNNHTILCLQNYHINSFVDITAKRRRHHPSSDVSPPYARYILGGGGAGSGDQSLPVHIRWLPNWFAGSKPEPNWMLLCRFHRAWTCLSFSSADVTSILNTDRVGKPAANHY